MLPQFLHNLIQDLILYQYKIIIIPQNRISLLCSPLIVTKITIVILGHSFLLHEVISLILIPKAPSPANPTTGVSGLPIFAPKIEGNHNHKDQTNQGLNIFFLFQILDKHCLLHNYYQYHLK